MELLTQNTKLKNTSKIIGKRVFNFGITAYKSITGKIICPFADKCVEYCYAQKGAYSWSNVKPAFEKRYEITKQDNFIELMNKEIKRKKVDFLRVHDSGDFYSNAYIQKWFKIANQNPNVNFYAYTKSIPLFKGLAIPENFDIIFSEGSKVDELINVKTDRHAKIFNSVEELEKAGYINASKNDLNATKFFTNNHKVGLVYH
tara:strand:- start:9114 stop:9719 length:606 start_codon:yes stop_codon:yes gene_type:complete